MGFAFVEVGGSGNIVSFRIGEGAQSTYDEATGGCDINGASIASTNGLPLSTMCSLVVAIKADEVVGPDGHAISELAVSFSCSLSANGLPGSSYMVCRTLRSFFLPASFM